MLGDHASKNMSSLGNHASMSVSSLGDHVSVQFSGFVMVLVPQQAKELLWHQIKRTETCSVAQPIWYMIKMTYATSVTEATGLKR